MKLTNGNIIMKNAFVFDVDGTLTPHRSQMDPDFQQFFIDFAKKHDCFLVTGSDYEKTLEQVGPEIMDVVKGMYNCNGSVLTVKGETQYVKNWEYPAELVEFLEEALEVSTWQQHFGNHIEDRGVMINFSIIGRNCPHEARLPYYEWDFKARERLDLCDALMDQFDVDATAGGQISIDINPKGVNKAQILPDLEEYDHIDFFGDNMGPGGNDRPLAQALVDTKRGIPYTVQDWTWTKPTLELVAAKAA